MKIERQEYTEVVKPARLRRVSFTVSFILPADATIDDARGYVRDAVQTYRGGLRPPFAQGDDDDGDPMWGLDRDTVMITKQRPNK